jgi:hypothetical protein
MTDELVERVEGDATWRRAAVAGVDALGADGASAGDEQRVQGDAEGSLLKETVMTTQLYLWRKYT